MRPCIKITSCIFFSILVIAGCSKSLNRQELSGEISWKGKPVLIGSITFVGEDDKNPTTISAEIKDGIFTVPKENGLVPGNYKVRFSALDRIAIAPADTTLPAIPPKEILPEKHTVQGMNLSIKDGEKNFFKLNLD